MCKFYKCGECTATMMEQSEIINKCIRCMRNDKQNQLIINYSSHTFLGNETKSIQNKISV